MRRPGFEARLLFTFVVYNVIKIPIPLLFPQCLNSQFGLNLCWEFIRYQKYFGLLFSSVKSILISLIIKLYLYTNNTATRLSRQLHFNTRVTHSSIVSILRLVRVICATRKWFSSLILIYGYYFASIF